MALALVLVLQILQTAGDAAAAAAAAITEKENLCTFNAEGYYSQIDANFSKKTKGIHLEHFHFVGISKQMTLLIVIEIFLEKFSFIFGENFYDLRSEERKGLPFCQIMAETEK